MAKQQPLEVAAIRRQQLKTGLRDLIVLERSVAAEALKTRRAADCSTLAPFVREAEAMAGEHAASLAMRLAALGGAPAAFESPPAKNGHPVLAAVYPDVASLQRLYVEIQGAISGYVTIQTLSHRFRDSWRSDSDGTTAHLARRFTQEYLGLVERLPRLIYEVLLHDMADEGLWCDCDCASCGMGLCLCGATSEVIWREAWRAAGQSETGIAGVVIPAPRQDSPAAAAGFRAGDCVTHAGGVEIDSIATLQTAVTQHTNGDPVPFVVMRDGAAVQLSAVRQGTLGHSGDEIHEGEDCLQPSGQTFYLDRARDLQRQFRRGGQPVVVHPEGFAGLTAREMQVLRLVADGATNAMIARKLRIQPPTVKRHVSSILTKLGVGNRAQAAALATAQGLTTDS